jgi:hypothetical protein
MRIAAGSSENGKFSAKPSTVPFRWNKQSHDLAALGSAEI